MKKLLLAGILIAGTLVTASSAFAGSWEKKGDAFGRVFLLEDPGMIERVYLAEKVDIARHGGFRQQYDIDNSTQINAVNWFNSNISGNGNTVNQDGEVNGDTQQGNATEGSVSQVNKDENGYAF
jgi:hypothetical protein